MEITRYERHGVLFDSCAAMEEAGFPNGFSTRVGGVSPPPWDSLNLGASCGDQPERVAENFRRFCGAVGTDADALVKNHQVHGDLVRPVTRADVLPSPGAPGTVEADGLITRTPGLCLTVFSADCIPVLLCDPRKKVAAAVHAGWRGTALGIAARAAEAMIRNFGCRPGDLMAAIGPGISLCCFETHGDVPAGLRAGSRHGPIPCGPEGRQPPVAAPGRPVSPPYRGLFGLHRLRQRRFLVPPPAGLPPGQPGLCDPDPLRCP